MNHGHKQSWCARLRPCLWLFVQFIIIIIIIIITIVVVVYVVGCHGIGVERTAIGRFARGEGRPREKVIIRANGTERNHDLILAHKCLFKDYSKTLHGLSRIKPFE